MQGRFSPKFSFFLEQMTLVGKGWPKPGQNCGQKGYRESSVAQISTNTIYFLGVVASVPQLFKPSPPTEMGLCFPFHHGTQHGNNSPRIIPDTAQKSGSAGKKGRALDLGADGTPSPLSPQGSPPETAPVR